MILLIVLGGLFGFILIYLLVIIFFPILSVKSQPMERIKNSNGPVPLCRKSVEYSIDGETIRSWLYLPENISTPVPCIILANGFGGTKDIILEKYALRFINEGFAAIAIDYRHFGESDGRLRQFYSSIKQIEDIKTTIKFIRYMKEIDGNQIFLWGTSAAGGYGLSISADDHKIAGVVAQCTALDHKKDDKLIMKREGIGFLLKLIVHAQRDKGRGRFGLSPHMIPLVGKPGTTALLNAPGALEGYSSLIHKSSLFKNEICPRIMLMRQAPDVMTKIQNVISPVLLQVCEKDTLVAPDSHVRAAEIMGYKIRVILYPIGHFDIYKGENFEIAIKEQIRFIKGVLEGKR